MRMRQTPPNHKTVTRRVLGFMRMLIKTLSAPLSLSFSFVDLFKRFLHHYVWHENPSPYVRHDRP
jgi:hypothetical protein